MESKCEKRIRSLEKIERTNGQFIAGKFASSLDYFFPMFSRHANPHAQLVYPLGGDFCGQANEKWRIGIAIGAAVLLHFAAILAGAFHYPEPSEELLALPAGIVEVMIEAAPPIEDLIPPPDAEVPPPAPDLTDELLFPEERISPPPVRQLASKPIVKVRKETSGSIASPSAKALALSAPWPEYPSEALQNKISGNGVVVMTIDPITGSVTNASMWRTTGSPYLDDAAIRAFRRWRFKPGSVSKVKSPVTFRLTAGLD